jgi:hypothetical protein
MKITNDACVNVVCPVCHASGVQLVAWGPFDGHCNAVLHFENLNCRHHFDMEARPHRGGTRLIVTTAYWADAGDRDCPRCWRDTGADSQALRLGRALQEVMRLARQKTGGHFALLGFSGNARAALGTPELSVGAERGYWQVQAAPCAGTVLGVLEQLAENPLAFQDVDADAERASFERKTRAPADVRAWWDGDPADVSSNPG